MKQLFDAHPFDCVVHLAARAGVRPSLENPTAYVRTNVLGTTKRDYTLIVDIVKGIRAAIAYDKTPYEIVNLGGGEPITLARMIATIEKVLGKKAQIVKKPMQPGDVVKTVCNWSKARRLFGYVPSTKFEDGIRAFVEWRRTR